MLICRRLAGKLCLVFLTCLGARGMVMKLIVTCVNSLLFRLISVLAVGGVMPSTTKPVFPLTASLPFQAPGIVGIA